MKYLLIVLTVSSVGCLSQEQLKTEFNSQESIINAALDERITLLKGEFEESRELNSEQANSLTKLQSTQHADLKEIVTAQDVRAGISAIQETLKRLDNIEKVLAELQAYPRWIPFRPQGDWRLESHQVLAEQSWSELLNALTLNLEDNPIREEDRTFRLPLDSQKGRIIPKAFKYLLRSMEGKEAVTFEFRLEPKSESDLHQWVYDCVIARHAGPTKTLKAILNLHSAGDRCTVRLSDPSAPGIDLVTADFVLK